MSNGTNPGPGGQGGGKLGGGNINEKKSTDVWSYRHDPNNAPFVDAINSAARTLENDFPGLMKDVNKVNAVELGGNQRTQVLGYYMTDGSGKHSVNINTEYTDIDVMNATMDAAAKSGFHPSRGNKSGTEAVALHEFGHALTEHIAKKMNIGGIMKLDAAADQLVADARKSAGKIAGKKGIKQFRESISEYAGTTNAEAVAEAVADYYCNGKNASTASKAIMAEIYKYR